LVGLVCFVLLSTGQFRMIGVPAVIGEVSKQLDCFIGPRDGQLCLVGTKIAQVRTTFPDRRTSVFCLKLKPLNRLPEERKSLPPVQAKNMVSPLQAAAGRLEYA